MAKRTSIKDIANKLNVSNAVVSYVLNGKEKEKRVGKELANKIKQTAKELNYLPNQIAQSLRKGETQTLGLIVADISNPFFSNLARAIEDEAAKIGYTVIIGSSDEDSTKLQSLINTFYNRQVDGLIIVPTEWCKEQIETLPQRNIPFVLIDRNFDELPTDAIMLDNEKAVKDAVIHLINEGYSRISMIAFDSALNHMQQRIDGYQKSMNNNGLHQQINIEKLKHDNIAQELKQCMENIISKKKHNAIICANNELTLQTLYYLQEKMIRVPEELAIIGFDGNSAFDLFYSPISYIEQPILEFGKSAVANIVQQIKGDHTKNVIKLEPKLVKRQSSTAPLNTIK